MILAVQPPNCNGTIKGPLLNVLVFSAEEIHSVGTINNVKTSYFTQLKYVT